MLSYNICVEIPQSVVGSAEKPKIGVGRPAWAPYRLGCWPKKCDNLGVCEWLLNAVKCFQWVSSWNDGYGHDSRDQIFKKNHVLKRSESISAQERNENMWIRWNSRLVGFIIVLIQSAATCPYLSKGKRLTLKENMKSIHAVSTAVTSRDDRQVNLQTAENETV